MPQRQALPQWVRTSAGYFVFFVLWFGFPLVSLYGVRERIARKMITLQYDRIVKNEG
jgi:hypothetical protein